VTADLAGDIFPYVEPAIVWISLFVIGSGLLQNGIYALQLAVAFRALRSQPPGAHEGALWAQYSEAALPIALLVPAYNEEATIVENIRSLMSLHYPQFEIIVINDGSKDETVAAVMAAYGLTPIRRSYEEAVPHKPIRGLYGSPNHPNLLLIDKENGGKSDALNAGINLSRAPLFCAVDADSILESDSLLRIVQPYIEDPDRMIAVGGTIRIVNGCTVRAGKVVQIALPRQFLPLLQTIEYLRAFLMARLAWSRMGVMMLISGAFGLFRREAAVAVGGYSHGTVGEDLELIVKMHRQRVDSGRSYAMRFIPEPVCWTEAPSSWRVLARQRIRWQRGSLETFWKHRDMALNPRYGRVGIFGFGHLLLVDVLGPPIDVLGYLLMPLFYALGLLNWDYFLAFVALTFITGIFISIGSLMLEELELRRFPGSGQLFVLTAVAIVENFGYRQINNIWRIVGWWHFLRGTQGWGAMTRTGFRKAS